MERRRLSMREAAAEAANLRELGEPIVIDIATPYQSVKPEPTVLENPQPSPAASNSNPKSGPTVEVIASRVTLPPPLRRFHATPLPVVPDCTALPRKPGNENLMVAKLASKDQPAALDQMASSLKPAHQKAPHVQMATPSYEAATVVLNPSAASFETARKKAKAPRAASQSPPAAGERVIVHLSAVSTPPNPAPSSHAEEPAWSTSGPCQSTNSLPSEKETPKRANPEVNGKPSKQAEPVVKKSRFQPCPSAQLATSSTDQPSSQSKSHPSESANSLSNKRPRSPNKRNVLDETRPLVKRSRFQSIPTSRPEQNIAKHPSPSPARTTATVSSPSVKRSVLSPPATRTFSPRPADATPSIAQKPHSPILRSRQASAVQAVGCSRPPPLRKDAHDEITPVPQKSNPSPRRVFQPFQPTASSRRRAAGLSTSPISAGMSSLQSSRHKKSPTAIRIQIPRSVPPPDSGYPKSTAVGWRESPSIHPPFSVYPSDYSDLNGYARMQAIHARSHAQMAEPHGAEPKVSWEQAVTARARETRAAVVDLTGEDVDSSGMRGRVQSSSVERRSQALHISRENADPMGQEGGRNLIEAYGPQIDPRRDPDLHRLLRQNDTTLLGLLRKYALLLVDPLDDDESTWMACKFCPTFQCTHRNANYIMMLVTPFATTRFLSHHKREHAVAWEKYCASSDIEKDRFFDKFKMPGRKVFMKRLLALRPAWERCGKKKPMIVKRQFSQSDSELIENAMEAAAIEGSSLDRFHLVPDGNSEGNYEDDGASRFSGRDPSIAAHVSSDELCAGRRNVGKDSLKEESLDALPRRAVRPQKFSGNPLTALGLQDGHSRRNWISTQVVNIILSGVLSDKRLRPATAEIGWFCPRVYTSEQFSMIRMRKKEEPKLRLTSMVMFYLMRGIPLNMICDMMMQGKMIVESYGDCQGRKGGTEIEGAGRGDKSPREHGHDSITEGYVDVVMRDVAGDDKDDKDDRVERMSVDGGWERSSERVTRDVGGIERWLTQAIEKGREDHVKRILEEYKQQEHEEEILSDDDFDDWSDESVESLESGYSVRNESNGSEYEGEDNDVENIDDGHLGPINWMDEESVEKRSKMNKKWVTEANIWNCGNSICAEGMRVFREKFGDSVVQYGMRGIRGFILGTRRCEALGIGGVEVMGTVQAVMGKWVWMHILSIGEGEGGVEGLKQMLDCIIGNWRVRILGLRSGLREGEEREREVERRIVEMLKGEEGVGKWFKYMKKGEIMRIEIGEMTVLEMLQTLMEYGEWFSREYPEEMVSVDKEFLKNVKAECVKLARWWKHGQSEVEKPRKQVKMVSKIVTGLNKLWGVKWERRTEVVGWRGAKGPVVGEVNVLLERMHWARNLVKLQGEYGTDLRWARGWEEDWSAFS